MKVQVPDQLKADMPPTTWSKIMAATPVVMAVVATMLAGLASSEMTKAQYDRALAAQQQSKAGDQWSFFQAKRLRGALQRNTADLMQATAVVARFNAVALKSAVDAAVASPATDKARSELQASLDSAAGQQGLAFLEKGEVPRPATAAPVEPEIKAALEGMETMKPDTEMVPILAKVSEQMLAGALLAARDAAQDLDVATKPVNQLADQIDAWLTLAVGQGGGDALRALNRDFTAARLKYAAQRYEIEARLNQGIANFYELQVRKSNISAERHHARSQRFFFGMLGAQLGVIISTFAMAARKHNVLWSLAAAAGLLAIAFAIYVYLYI
jgi:hypothetical protein